MAPNDRGMKNGEGESRKALKKGPWTAAEDAILMEYVNKYGEGNWNAVQRNSGLKRCGKSCRLRWANHLRPNLKKGVFSPEEERIIIELHAKLGNKWARMAAQLPGRTDNEIKNYWNTRLKRRQRAGLPIYPQELQSQNQQETNEVQSLISSSAFDSQRATYNNSPSLSHLDIFNPSTITHQFPFNSNNTFRDPSLSSIKNSQFSSLSASVGLSNSMLLPSFQQKYPNFKLRTMGIPSNQNELISVIGINYPSGQSSMRVMTASSSENTCSDFGSSDANNYAKVSQGNSGLLEDLLEESQTLTRAVKIEENNYLNLKEEEAKNYKGKSLWEEYGIVEQESGDEEAILTEESVYSFAHAGDVTLNNNSQSSSPDPNSSSGMLMTKQVDEDIMCLLDNFPLGVSVPDLYDVRDDKNKSNGQSSNIDKAAEESKSQVVITTSVLKNHNWELGGYCWNNMPSFC